MFVFDSKSRYRKSFKYSVGCEYLKQIERIAGFVGANTVLSVVSI